MPAATFRGWAETKPSFIRVVPAPELEATSSSATLSIESPGGYRVVGLTLDGVATLLERLSGC